MEVQIGYILGLGPESDVKMSTSPGKAQSAQKHVFL